MINYNGNLISSKELQLSYENRAFKYGDGIFETVKIQNNKIVFWEDHYFRLMASMRMLRMNIPMSFTLEYLEEQILKTVASYSSAKNVLRARLSVYRQDGGLYTPKTNAVDFLIDVKEVSTVTKDVYRIDLYKDFYNYSGLLSTVKTTNRMLNTLAAVFAEENDLDNCILLNERKSVVEVTNGNIFVVKGNVVKTPALTEGCIKGVARKKIIEIIEKNKDYTLEETAISPFEIQKADEVFISNAIMGVQSVTNYRKKTFATDFGKKLGGTLNFIAITG